MANVFRVEFRKTKEGIYSNGSYFTYDANDKEKELWKEYCSLQDKMNKNFDPTPATDFRLTHHHEHHSCKTDEEWDEVIKFQEFYESRLTKYACSKKTDIARWLGYNKRMIEILNKLGFQLVEYFIEDKYCYFLKHQVLFNSKFAKKVKTHHLFKDLTGVKES